MGRIKIKGKKSIARKKRPVGSKCFQNISSNTTTETESTNIIYDAGGQQQYFNFPFTPNQNMPSLTKPVNTDEIITTLLASFHRRLGRMCGTNTIYWALRSLNYNWPDKEMSQDITTIRDRYQNTFLSIKTQL